MTDAPLQRQVGVLGAVMLGLGSIVGTGVFVSIGMAAGVAGPAVVVAIAIGALVATCNGLSSAQLAAAHPVAGGTYEYGYRLLHPAAGFTAGWMFLCAKSASAATAALGFAGYVVALFAGDTRSTLGLALGLVVVLTTLVYSGLRRSNAVNLVIVSITLATLAFFVVSGLPSAVSNGRANLRPFLRGDLADLLQAAAMMFVAYTGYGRIATMGEEITQPRRNIPRAIIATLLVSMVLYLGVGAVGVAAVGPQGLATGGTQVAPLEVAARTFGVPGAGVVLAVGAVTAMAGVLLNLILGLSRVLLAMGRRGDMPAAVARVAPRTSSPTAAVLVMGAAIAALVLVFRDVKTAWQFSAFTVLIYYALTNLSALQLPEEQRLYARAWSWGGLAACLFLAFWVPPTIWAAGLGLIAAGLIWHGLARRAARR